MRLCCHLSVRSTPEIDTIKFVTMLRSSPAPLHTIRAMEMVRIGTDTCRLSLFYFALDVNLRRIVSCWDTNRHYQLALFKIFCQRSSIARLFVSFNQQYFCEYTYVSHKLCRFEETESPIRLYEKRAVSIACYRLRVVAIG